MKKVNRGMEEPGNLMVGTRCGSNTGDWDEVEVVKNNLGMHSAPHINKYSFYITPWASLDEITTSELFFFAAFT